MEAEASSWFESSEMLASFLSSTQLLSDSWSLCSRANTAAPGSFTASRIGDAAYVAFSAVQSITGLDPGLVPLEAGGGGLFPAMDRRREGDEEPPVMVHAGFLHLFINMFEHSNFQPQMFEMLKGSKSVVFTGHSIGGTLASLSALWLLSHLQSISSPLHILCITFGSPLLSNKSLSRAILQERWGGNFIHTVAKHDIVPRLLLAPLSPITAQLHSLLQFWHMFLASPNPANPFLALPDEEANSDLFLFVLGCVQASADNAGEVWSGRNSFWPFGSYVFLTNEGMVCVDNRTAVMKLLHLNFATATASSSIRDHLMYEHYVTKLSLQFLTSRGGFTEMEFPESSYEAGLTLALQSSQLESTHAPARECLKQAKRMGRTPNLNSANLAIALSKITPLRAQLEWYKASCDGSDDHMGYYDTFKLRGASKREAKVNMNRIKLARFWDDLIQMLDTNQLPHDFHKREKWVNASHFYKLMVEPLDIAEYYRTGLHRVKGHYVNHGRERRYEVFDKWWREREVGEDENRKRSTYASLTQDSCFWARLEEAKEWLDCVRSESDTRKLSLLWEAIDEFENYARTMVERKEVSRDVLEENSSYSLWMKELTELKSQLWKFPHQFSRLFEGGVVP